MHRLIYLVLVFIAVMFATPNSARSDFLLTNNSNGTLANLQVESGDDLSDNPNVVNGFAGNLLSYTATADSFGGNYGLNNLNDGDVGLGVASDGTYAIAYNGTPLTLNLVGGPQAVTSIAVYNGYTNRDDGTYLIQDAANNTIVGYTISNTLGGTNNGADSFWLTFSSPVTTSAVRITFVSSDVILNEPNTASFREVQLFSAVPEPFSSTLALVGLGGVFVASRTRLIRK